MPETAPRTPTHLKKKALMRVVAKTTMIRKIVQSCLEEPIDLKATTEGKIRIEVQARSISMQLVKFKSLSKSSTLQRVGWPHQICIPDVAVI